LYLAGLEALRADVFPSHLAQNEYPDLLKVRKPPSLCLLVGMAYGVPCVGFFAADKTSE
jgi:hypothetical protein